MLYNWSKHETSARIARKEAEMPPLYVLSFILLIGLFLLLLLVTSFTLNRTRDWRSCLLPLLGLGLIVVIILFLDPKKRYECSIEVPDQIRVTGHLKGNSTNDYLVFLYKGDQEIDRFVTQNGRPDPEQEARDGYFELTAANEFENTRCSMALAFEQESVGRNLLWLQNRTTYLWHHFGELDAGTVQPLNDDDRRKTYTLVVSADKVGPYPDEIVLYSTYLDRQKNLAINLPVKTYRMQGNAAVETMTGFFTHPGRLPETPQWPVFSITRDVRDAWVVDSNPLLTERRSPLESHIIDRNNCTGEHPQTDTVRIPLIYVKEVQFQESADLNFHLGVAASKSAGSLGFTQGQMATVVAPVPGDVPAGTFVKYKLFWHDVWSSGTMVIDFGPSNIRVPFRARTGMSWTIERYAVDCPP